jgi:hypothetical protein
MAPLYIKAMKKTTGKKTQKNRLTRARETDILSIITAMALKGESLLWRLYFLTHCG